LNLISLLQRTRPRKANANNPWYS
jgi:hypothetical protein